MPFSIPGPTNKTQVEFNKLCVLGGGPKGGPARTRVQELLRASGKRLNKMAYREVEEGLADHPDANPWHVCFAISMTWGHLARLSPAFLTAAVRLMTEWNDEDLKVAKAHAMERGTDPIEQSLRGAHMLFEKVKLPEILPDTLAGLAKAQERWLGRILGPDRPPYIGSWNATAMFMIALFAQPKLAATHLNPEPVLPPGGPIFKGLQYLHQAGVLSKAPAGSDLDDGPWEPGVLYENNALLAELLKGYPDWAMIDAHSGVYMLGTRHPDADSWE